MALKVYNVRTRDKELFTPIEPGKVGFYLCGLTVYDHMHIGHARTAVSFEVVRRWLEHHYDDVTFSQNVTDVDDKIIARAEELGVSPLEHAATWDAECRHQTDRLGVRAPDAAPHATTSMDGIIQYIQAIIERGFAYATDSGNVYFDVPKYDEYAQKEFPEMGYGTLSRRDFREMAAGTRKEVESDKQHPADFALWKAAKPSEPADSQWSSPWGSGRPGWHIECSHMSTDTLGADQIDFHGGGQDLIFPHHENEIAQTQAKTGKAPFVNVWMHTGFLNVEGVKMSKSLGNFITLKEMLDELEEKGEGPEPLRFYFIQTHYRSKIDFSRKGLDEAIQASKRLRRTREDLFRASHGDGTAPAEALVEATQALRTSFAAAMDDDFHTPTALAALFTFQKVANSALEAGDLDAAAAMDGLAAFEEAGQILTLFADTLGGAEVDAAIVPLLDSLGIDARDEEAAMEAIIEKRAEARAAKDWGTADQIRDGVAAAGYAIEDGKAGTRWRRA